MFFELLTSVVRIHIRAILHYYVRSRNKHLQIAVTSIVSLVSYRIAGSVQLVNSSRYTYVGYKTCIMKSDRNPQTKFEAFCVTEVFAKESKPTKEIYGNMTTSSDFSDKTHTTPGLSFRNQ